MPYTGVGVEHLRGNSLCGRESRPKRDPSNYSDHVRATPLDRGGGGGGAPQRSRGEMRMSRGAAEVYRRRADVEGRNADVDRCIGGGGAPQRSRGTTKEWRIFGCEGELPMFSRNLKMRKSAAPPLPEEDGIYIGAPEKKPFAFQKKKTLGRFFMGT